MVDRVGLRALFALAGRHLSRWAATLGLAGVVVGIAPSSARAQAPVVTAPSAVGVHLLAIEASKEQRGFDEPLRAAGLAAKIEELGYVGAKLADELRTSVEPDASVSLELFAKSAKKRMLTVKVLEVKPDEVRLHVAIPELKFGAETVHRKGGTFLVAHKLDAATALFLAVTPKR
jgi:hypothetical protein